MSEETQAPVEQAAETTQPEAPQQESTPKAHPGWDNLLSELPEAWHSKVTPYLVENDKNVQAQLEKYTPFKEYVEQGISADTILGGINLARAIESNPTEVYASLQEYLRGQGLLADEAASAAQDIMESESGEDFETIFDDQDVPPALKKQLEELKAQQAKQEDYIYQQELAKETEQAIQQIDAEMNQLKSQYQITEAHETAIYELMNAALNAGNEISVAEAAQRLQSMIGGFQPVGAAPAQDAPPTIVGSAGGAGIPAPNLGIPKDDKGKKQMLQQMFEEYKRANQ